VGVVFRRGCGGAQFGVYLAHLFPPRSAAGVCANQNRPNVNRALPRRQRLEKPLIAPSSGDVLPLFCIVWFSIHEITWLVKEMDGFGAANVGKKFLTGGGWVNKVFGSFAAEGL